MPTCWRPRPRVIASPLGKGYPHCSRRTDLRIAMQTRLILFVAPLCFLVPSLSSYGQAPTASPAKKPPMGPPAPQSKHYPILILAFGNDPNWSLRIGQKGPERLDRPGYPPIPLEPAEVTHEAAADSWTYHAKDTATGAVVALHLTREACTDATNDTLTATPPPSGKYPFQAALEHAQIGTPQVCTPITPALLPQTYSQAEDHKHADHKKHST